MARRGWPQTQLVYWCTIAGAVAAVGLYYLWQVRSAGYKFDWKYGSGGYYNYLGRAFAHGDVALPIKPAPELLALANPWDPAVGSAYKMHDMAFFRGRYYLYHGAGPAVLLFTPWLLITGHDLPENFALLLLCFGGFVFSCGVLREWLALAGAKIGPPLLALMLLALGLCQSVPYLLSRVWVYEVAIGGGYFCLSGALYCLARGVRPGGSCRWFAASGLMFGLAVSCRPHLVLAGMIALAGLTVWLARSRGLRSAMLSAEVVAFAAALALVGALIAAYNYQRFGDPFEFGLRHLLAGANQNRIRLAPANVLPGLYFWLACPPDFSPVFPWVRLAVHHPFHSPNYPLPAGYFLEITAGALFLAPVVAAALFIPLRARLGESGPQVRFLLCTALASSTAILLFLAATGFTTQRYEVDFLPVAVLVAVANFGIHIDRSKARRRIVLCAGLAAAIICGAVTNMALGISGPYDEMLKNRPGSYVRLARWFSPVERFRPMMNPTLDVKFTAEFMPHQDHLREPLVTIGGQVHRYFLYAEHSDGRVLLVSRYEDSTVVHDLDFPGDRRAEIRATYAPGSGTLTVTLYGREFLVHHIGTLVTSPAEVTIGENRVDPDMTVPRFTGRIYDAVRTVR